MKVHLIKKQSIENFALKNSQSREAFSGWIAIIKVSEWKFPNDIISTFNTADILGSKTSRVIF